ncbi:hypothetical protein EVB81_191 [Rhizobium phage RHph_I46]|uniref:Uncharacterized protein n=1 Tax=Rhizobium phage RHph_I1_9 TaxID=2509729 RepID=A0A7S5UYK7_9CAUD|nr:hypothetical protein PP936_gp189 [Rhizobium phage RHph_I1_9]QIG69760.1 hypothetical protein EVB81_191 [Rhizobium phage RHph_I46]QIG71041.1 hypothetical protein EVB92_191 [Rhizobium phage RHph_I9]QIG73626.1 hypothetical protein EVC04_189 [Rhizobium phage RHph_I1_9]QIG76380.1 hypothetical protein EVC25_191 [Rhizobium phage RHph_I34]
MVQKTKIISGVTLTDSKIGEREITVRKQVIRETLTIDHELVEKIVYEWLNHQGLINDCDKFSLEPNMSHDFFSNSYELVLEKLLIEGRDNKITEVNHGKI